MYVDVRWIILVVVVAGVIVVAAMRPDLAPALTLGVGACGLFYVLLRLGDGGRGEDGDGTASTGGDSDAQ